MNGFEPRTYGIESDHSTNWATTTAPKLSKFIITMTRVIDSSFVADLWNFIFKN